MKTTDRRTPTPARKSLDLPGTPTKKFAGAPLPLDPENHLLHDSRRMLARCLRDFEKALRVSMKGRPLSPSRLRGGRVEERAPEWIDNC